jgi:hypothetical protein
MATDINKDLFDAILKQQIAAGQYASKQAQDIRKLLKGAERQLMAEIAAAGNAGTFTAVRRDALLAEIRRMYAETYQTAADNLKAEMQGYAVHAGEVATATIASQLPASVSFLSMTVDQLEALVSRSPITVGEGKRLLFGELFKSYEAAVVEDITGAVRTGMVLGKSNQDIARAIRQVIIDNGITEKHARYADNLARTITNSVGNRATMATYEKSDVVKGWIFLATLDGKTSITCRALSNTRWPIGEGPLPPPGI